MNDEQLSQPSNTQAEQDQSISHNASENGSAGDNSPAAMAGNIGHAQVGDVDAPTQGYPMPKAEGHSAPEPSTISESGEETPSMPVEQAETLTSYHPVEPVGETPEEGVQAKEQGETQAAAESAAPEAPAGEALAPEAQAEAPEASVSAAGEAPTGEGEPDELQVVRSTRDRRLNEMAPNASMEDLLKASEQQYRTLKHGDVIEGTVMKLDRDEILVDIGSKSEGIIPSHELQSLTDEERTAMQIGDEVLVSVVQPENAEGHAILSLDRARQEKSWRDLQRKFEAGEIIQAPVSGYNKGGLLVNLGGVRGFVPASQVSSIPPSEMNKQAEMARLQGTLLPLKIIEINRGRNRLILSERQAIQEQREVVRSRLLRELEPGQIRPGTVSSICDFGAFVDIGGADGLIHLSELSWKRVSHPSDVLKVGDHIDVYVLSVDPSERKIALSLKRTQPEPWSTITDNYHLGQIVKGTITQLTNFGAFARLEDGIEGLIHVSELAEGRVAHPRNVVKEGDVLDLKVIRIDPAKKRIGLSLKRVNEDVEGAGESARGPVDEDTAQEFGGAGGAASLAEGGPQAGQGPQSQYQQTQQGGQFQRGDRDRDRDRERERSRDRDRDRDRERENARPLQTTVSNLNIPSPDEEEPMGVMAQAFAALAQRTRGSQQEDEEQEEAGTAGAAQTAPAASVEPAAAAATAHAEPAEPVAPAAPSEEPEALMPSAVDVSEAETVAPELSEAPEAPEASTSAAVEAPASAVDTVAATDVVTDSGDTGEGAADNLSTGGPGTSEVLTPEASEGGAAGSPVGTPVSGSEGAPSTADNGSLEPTAEPGVEGETGEDETLG